MEITRVYLLVLDGLGIGNAPDAEDYGDAGSDTLAHVTRACGLDYPNLTTLGLGNLYEGGLPGIPATDLPRGVCGRLTEVSTGKDTTTGHWEMMGLIRQEPAPTFPDGFPASFIAEFSQAVGREVIGNTAASGTEIIQQLGDQHLATGKLIVYTSADSVFQIAAHEDIVPLPELYAACRIARTLLTGDLSVDRVIARPFTGSSQAGFHRTQDRRDFSLAPPGDTVLTRLKELGFDVIGVGKIRDIFLSRGLTASLPVHGNDRLLKAISDLSREVTWKGLVFCNLVDFDMLYGHRNNVTGYAEELGRFDQWLGEFISVLGDNELLILTADHGNDPTTESTDHSREQVPVVMYGNAIAQSGGWEAKPEPGFYHVGKTVLNALGVDGEFPGSNLLNK